MYQTKNRTFTKPVPTESPEAVFRSVFSQGERIGAGPVLRAWRGLLLTDIGREKMDAIRTLALTLVVGYICYRVVRDREGAPDPVDALVGKREK